MSKEKQIEEMANIICGGCAVDHKHCGFISKSKLCPTVLSDSETLYTAGYRKQIEGEWKVEEFYNSGLRMHFGTNITCSCCGYTERKGSAFFTPSNFCPNCGAKMKGGE